MKITTTTTTSSNNNNFESWNVDNQFRIVTINPDTRYNPVKRPGSNQITVNNPNYINNTYKWLVGTTTEFKNETKHFTCWEPSGTGIDDTDSGYKRFSYKGDKILCHRFVWYFFNPGKLIPNDHDISHLCGNKRCCRPSHLYCEPKPNNVARINCIAYLVADSNHDSIMKICIHNVPCKTAKYISKNNLVTLQPEK
jgi:hypothetical protein